MRFSEVFRRLFFFSLCSALVTDISDSQVRLNQTSSSILLPDELIDYIMSFCSRKPIYNRAVLHRNYIGTLGRFGLTDCRGYASLAPLYKTVDLHSLCNIYYFSRDLDFFLDFSADVATICTLGLTIGPIGCAMYLKYSSPYMSPGEYLDSLNQISAVMKFSFQSSSQKHHFQSLLLGAFFQRFANDFDRLFELQLTEQLYAPLALADKDQLLVLARKSLASQQASTWFKQCMAYALLCVHGDFKEEILALFGGQLWKMDLFSAFPLDIEPKEEIRASIFARNVDIIVALLYRLPIKHMRCANIYKLWYLNIIRYAGEEEIDGLDAEDLYKILRCNMSAISFVWGRESVHEAWGRCWHKLTAISNGFPRRIYTIIFNPTVLAQDPDPSWCLAYDTIRIVYACICEPLITESARFWQFIDMWYVALTRTFNALSLLTDQYKFIRCLLRAYAIAEQRHDENGQEAIILLYKLNEGRLFQVFVELEAIFLVPSFVWTLYADQGVEHFPILEKVILAYCYAVDAKHLRLLKRFIKEDPLTMTRAIVAAMRNLTPPAYAIDNYNFLIDYAKSVEVTPTCCFF